MVLALIPNSSQVMTYRLRFSAQHKPSGNPGISPAPRSYCCGGKRSGIKVFRSAGAFDLVWSTVEL